MLNPPSFNDEVVNPPGGKVGVPSLATANLLTPANCKSSSFDPAALAVSVMFNFNPLNATAALFHVCAKFKSGVSATTAPVDNANICASVSR